MKKERKSYSQDYEDFWKDIVEENGVLNLDQVKRELSDYHFLLEEVPKVYDAVSGGLISKPNTYAYEVLNEFNEKFADKGITSDDVTDMIKDQDNLEDLINDLKAYFDYERN